MIDQIGQFKPNVKEYTAIVFKWLHEILEVKIVNCMYSIYSDLLFHLTPQLLAYI